MSLMARLNNAGMGRKKQGNQTCCKMEGQNFWKSRHKLPYVARSRQTAITLVKDGS